MVTVCGICERCEGSGPTALGLCLDCASEALSALKAAMPRKRPFAVLQKRRRELERQAAIQALNRAREEICRP